MRPVIAVVTRWSFTLSMLIRYIRQKPFIDTSVLDMSKDKIKFGILTPVDVLSVKRQAFIEFCIEIMKHIETASSAWCR